MYPLKYQYQRYTDTITGAFAIHRIPVVPSGLFPCLILAGATQEEAFHQGDEGQEDGRQDDDDQGGREDQ